MFWIFLGIVIFISVFIPLFAPNLRYQVGRVFTSVFDFVGGICFYGGILLLIWGLAGLFCGKNFRSVKLLILGILMLWIAAFLLEPSAGFGFWNAIGFKGYH